MRFFYTILLIAVLTSCKNESEFRIDPGYESEYTTYSRNLADGRIKYLQLAGLFKFEEQESGFGSSESLAFNLESPSSIEEIGTFINNTDSSGLAGISFRAEQGLAIKTESDSVVNSINLTLDEYGSSQPLFLNDLKWQVITRSGSPYLRVWDKQHPMVSAFKGYECYPLTPEFIFNGQFKYYEKNKEMEVKSQLGVNATTSFIGRVEFEYNGKIHSLEVGSNGFTMVSDDTSGNETYGGGRYIYLDLPEEDGAVIVDFNRLYNPPCSFSQFTTCLYPPQENYLPFDLRAGETLKRL